MNTVRRLTRDVRWQRKVLSSSSQHPLLPSLRAISTASSSSSIITPNRVSLPLSASSASNIDSQHQRHGTNLNYKNQYQYQRYFTSSSTTDDEDSKTTSKTSYDSRIVEDKKQMLLASTLRKDAPEAQWILEDLEAIISSSSDQAETLLECRQAVLDAWITHQAGLVKEWEALDNSDERRKQLEEQIVEAANQAHEALEKTVPFLNRPSMMSSVPSKTKKKSPKSKEEEEDEDELALLEDTIGNPATTSTTASIKNRQFIVKRCNAVLAAWATASRVTAASGKSRKTKGIPQRATYLLQRMETAASNNTTATITPLTTTQSYNSVLEAWAWSREHLRATMAEQIFKSLKRNNAPDGASYRWIIQAWCQSGQRQSAFTATGHLMKWLRRVEYEARKQRYSGMDDYDDKDGMMEEPSVETYQMVMKTWTRAEDRNAPMKAAGILRIMESAHDRSVCSIPVDEACYRYYLMALSRWSVVPEQGPLADQIINKLKDKQIVPDQDCYGAAIRVHKNTALNPLFAQTREASITRAVELLEELSLAHHRTTMTVIKPQTQNYNDALQALSASYRSVSKEIADTLIKVMEESAVSDDSDIRPNPDSYKWLLAVYAKSKAPDKIEAARNVLARTKAALATTSDHLDDAKNPSYGESILGVYNAFLEVCASAHKHSDDDNQGLLLESLGAVKEMKSLYSLQPSPQTFARLLEVCEKHLSIGQERNRIIDTIFNSCRDDGLVDESVLRALKSVASEEQYMDLVISNSIMVEGTRMVPESWTSGFGVQRVVTADGRKAMPLSIDGRFTVTKAMKEYRMRKLRTKSNKRVLQGGRLQLDKKEMGKPIHIELD